MTYQTGHRATVLSTGPNYRPYVVLRLILNENGGAVAQSKRKLPAARDFDSIARTLLSNAQSDGGHEQNSQSPSAGQGHSSYSSVPNSHLLTSVRR